MSHMCLKFRDIHQNNDFTVGEKMINSQIRVSPAPVKQSHIPGTSMPCLHGMGSHFPARIRSPKWDVKHKAGSLGSSKEG